MTVTHRGTSNRNKNGSAVDRRRRKRWVICTYRADVDVLVIPRVWATQDPPADDVTREQERLLSGHLGDLLNQSGVKVEYQHELSDFPGPTVWTVPRGLGEAATRCYRCGKLLWYAVVEVDRIVPGWRKTAKYPRGGTYVRENIRPACERCNKITGNEDRWKNHKPFRLLAELLDLIRGDHADDRTD